MKTITIDLPSRGKLYKDTNPLSSGSIEIKYPSFEEEEILMDVQLIKSGNVLNEFLKSIIIDKTINIDELIPGDKNKILAAARIITYGKELRQSITCPSCNTNQIYTFDLNELDDVNLNFDNINENLFTTIITTVDGVENKISFKLLNSYEEKDALIEYENIKLKVGITASIHKIRLKRMILSVNDDLNKQTIIDFVDNLLTIEVSDFRKFIKNITPDITYTQKFICKKCTHEEEVVVPFGTELFWPSI